MRIYCGQKIRGVHLLADAGWEPILFGITVGNLFIGVTWWQRNEEKADEIEDSRCHVCGESFDESALCECERAERRMRGE